MTQTIVAGVIRTGADEPDAVVPQAPNPAIGHPYFVFSPTAADITSDGVVTFSVPRPVAYLVGARARATSGGSGEWMEGIVTAIGTNSVTILMDDSNGFGEHVDWVLTVVGEPALTAGYANAVNNAKLVESRLGGSAIYSLKTATGDDPSIDDPILVISSTGVIASITSPMSLTLSSGATLGTVNGVPFRVWFVVILDPGGIRLSAIQTRNASANTITPIGRLVSTTTPVGNNAGTFYANVAVSVQPGVPFAFAEYDAGLATAGSWNVAPSRIVYYGASVPLPGDILAIEHQYDSGLKNLSGFIPYDDTIPQSNEGAEAMSLTYTPISVHSVLEISAQLHANGTNTAMTICAMFHTSSANALATCEVKVPNAFGAFNMLTERLMVRHFPRAVSAQIYSCRVGVGSGGSGPAVYWNGDGVAARFGGTVSSYMRVLEIAT